MLTGVSFFVKKSLNVNLVFIEAPVIILGLLSLSIDFLTELTRGSSVLLNFEEFLRYLS